jgi:hypothetical protein
MEMTAILFFLIIMAMAGFNFNKISSNSINYSMFIINSSRPGTMIITFKGFWLSNAFKRVRLYRGDKFKYFENNILVAGFKTLQIINCRRSENYFSHLPGTSCMNLPNSSIVKTSPAPCLISSSAALILSQYSSYVSLRRRVLFGLFTLMVIAPLPMLFTRDFILLNNSSLNSDEEISINASISKYFTQN